MTLLKRLLVLIMVSLSLLAISCQCATTVEQVSVTLAPSLEEVKLGEQFEVEVQVEPGKQGISAVEINLSFDPQAVQAIEVKPGTLLGESPLPGILNIDNEAGTLGYSLARIGETKAPTPAATLATITFRVLNSAQPRNYELSFTGVGSANENFEDIPDIQVKGASVKISS